MEAIIDSVSTDVADLTIQNMSTWVDSPCSVAFLFGHVFLSGMRFFYFYFYIFYFILNFF